jgi:signal transduction histidine kinase
MPRLRDARPALDSVTRSMAQALGVGAAAFLALALADLLAQSAVFGVVWTGAAAAALYGTLLTGALLSRWLTTRGIRMFAGVAAIGQLVVLASLVPVLPDGRLPEQYGMPWPLGSTLLGCAAAAVAWRSSITWPYVAANVVLVGVDRFSASQRPIADLATQDALHTLLFTAVFTSLALAIRRAGRQLDEASDRAVADTRRLATSEARMRERTRIEALLHDSVLVALLASSRRPDAAAAAARDALERLDGLEYRSGDEGTEPVDPMTWLWRMQASTTQLDPTARFSHGGERTSPMPADVAEAMLEASAEALRNSVIHAGPASRAVHVQFGPSGIEVTVLDDGIGFDLRSVDEARLGARVSIRERMLSIPGGHGVVVSRPGLGTRVAIGWESA